LINLTLLNMSGNVIANVTPVASLTNLTQLDLHNNQITAGVGALAGLANLQYMVIHCDLSVIAGGGVCNGAACTCTDANGTGIPCGDLQSLINSVQSHGGGMGGIAQPSSAVSGVNCH
jgi:hypothetical protein